MSYTSSISQVGSPVASSFHSTGYIHQPSHLCPQDILDELHFWQIPIEPMLAPCCCYDQPEDEAPEDAAPYSERPNLFKNLCCGRLRRTAWDLLEEPGSSTYANGFAILSVFFVCVSIIGLVAGSVPELQVPAQKTKNASAGDLVEMEPHRYFGYVEYLCIVWFAMECEYGPLYSLTPVVDFLKMLVTPHRKKTFFELLNIIDLLSIIPFVIEVLLFVCGISTDQLRDLKGAFLVIRILRFLSRKTHYSLFELGCYGSSES